jgi:hypothetical protein
MRNRDPGMCLKLRETAHCSHMWLAKSAKTLSDTNSVGGQRHISRSVFHIMQKPVSHAHTQSMCTAIRCCELLRWSSQSPQPAVARTTRAGTLAAAGALTFSWGLLSPQAHLAHGTVTQGMRMPSAWDSGPSELDWACSLSLLHSSDMKVLA